MAQKRRPQAQTLSGTPQPVFTKFTPSSVLGGRAPTSLDTGFPLTQLWLDQPGGDLYALTSVSAGAATWSALGGSGISIVSAASTSAMVGGTITVSDATVTVSSIIIFCYLVPAGVTGWVGISAQSAGSFTLTSTNGNETSSFNYIVVK